MVGTALIGACIAGYFLLRRERVFDPAIMHEGAKCDPRELAFEVADEVVDRSPTRYSRRLLHVFQHQVGIPTTECYDGETYGALIAMGVPSMVLPPPDRGRVVAYFPEVT